MKPYTKEDVRTLGPGAEVYLQSRYPYAVPNWPSYIQAVNDDLVTIHIDTTHQTHVLYMLLYGVNVGDQKGWILWPGRPSPKDRQAVQWEDITWDEFKRRQLERTEAIEARLHAQQLEQAQG